MSQYSEACGSVNRECALRTPLAPLKYNAQNETSWKEVIYSMYHWRDFVSLESKQNWADHSILTKFDSLYLGLSNQTVHIYPLQRYFHRLLDILQQQNHQYTLLEFHSRWPILEQQRIHLQTQVAVLEKFRL